MPKRKENMLLRKIGGEDSLVEGLLYADSTTGAVGRAFVFEGHEPHRPCSSISFADGSVRSYMWSLDHLRMPTAGEKTRFYREAWKYGRG